jgi:uncharacterized protein with von Willebrand factor type A (vWA) domain
VSHFVSNIMTFGRLLRSLGLAVPVGRLLDVTVALQQIDVGSRQDVYFTCRTLLVHRHDDLAIFDAAFNAFWQSDAIRAQSAGVDAQDGVPRSQRSSRTGSGPARAQTEGENNQSAATTAGLLRTWSDVDVIARKDFAEFTGDEIAQAESALHQLVWTPGERRTRHWVPGRGSRLDLRRALARSVRTGGDVVNLPRRRRRTRPRPIVVLCDVSGSMERYSRMLLHFVHALSTRDHRVEAFLFSTQLTRITPHLRRRPLDQAAAAVSRTVPDWSGGTRIGEALRVFHQRWWRVVSHGGPIVLLISDGWDRGDPLMLRDQVARLQRSCHRLIWLNPLIGTLDYAPLTRGLVAALPFVDDFLPARTLTNLADLAAHLNSLVTPSASRAPRHGA